MWQLLPPRPEPYHAKAMPSLSPGHSSPTAKSKEARLPMLSYNAKAKAAHSLPELAADQNESGRMPCHNCFLWPAACFFHCHARLGDSKTERRDER